MNQRLRDIEEHKVALSCCRPKSRFKVQQTQKPFFIIALATPRPSARLAKEGRPIVGWKKSDLFHRSH